MSFVKRKIAIVLALMMLLSSLMVVAPASAAGEKKQYAENSIQVSGKTIHIIRSVNGKVKLNRKLLSYDPSVEIDVVKNDVLVPASKISKSLDLILKWDKSINTLVVGENKNARIVIQYPIGNTKFKVSYPIAPETKGFYGSYKSKIYNSELAPKMKNGQVLLPLKSLADILGYNWYFEDYPDKIDTSKIIPGVSGYVAKFNQARSNVYKYKADLEKKEAELRSIVFIPPYKVEVQDGKLEFVGDGFIVARGYVYKYGKQQTNNIFVKIHGGTSNNQFLNSYYEFDELYQWPDSTFKGQKIKTYSRNKTESQIVREKGLREAIASLKTKIYAQQSVAVKNRNLAYLTVDNYFASQIATLDDDKFKEINQIRFLYEKMIHHTELAQKLGLKVFNDIKFDPDSRNNWTPSGVAKEHISHIEDNITSDYTLSDKDATKDYDGKIALEIPALISQIQNEEIKIKAEKLKWIGDLQVAEALYDDMSYIKEKQKYYAGVKTNLNIHNQNDYSREIVINTAVTPRLMNIGVLALMEYAETQQTKDYYYAQFLVDHALYVVNKTKGQPFKKSLLNSKKQIELRLMRSEEAPWK